MQQKKTLKTQSKAEVAAEIRKSKLIKKKVQKYLKKIKGK